MTGNDTFEEGHILFIDDDADLLAAQVNALRLEGFDVTSFSGGPEALKQITADFDGVVVSDVRMPQMDGRDLFRQVQAIDADIPVILMTGHGDVRMAVEALKNGAYDFIAKPFALDELVLSLNRAIQKRRLVMENRQLRRHHTDPGDAETQLLGATPIMQHLKASVMRVGEADVDVLIIGETGVGKERVARAMHRLSARKSRPFVHVSCASLPEDRFDPDMFGVEPGHKSSVYGALSRRLVGRFEKAQKGTLFLDDVDGLSLPQQAKVLRVVEARELWSLGAEEPRALDIRIIAATKADLALAVESGHFRADLYYRLSGVTLKVPPLSQRRGDISLLFQHFLVNACARLKRPIPKLTAGALAWFQSHGWPGNVRELEQFADRFALGLDDARQPETGDPAGLAERVGEYEAGLIRETLAHFHGDARESMMALQVARKTFYDKLNRYGIQIRDYRP